MLQPTMLLALKVALSACLLLGDLVHGVLGASIGSDLNIWSYPNDIALCLFGIGGILLTVFSISCITGIATFEKKSGFKVLETRWIVKGIYLMRLFGMLSLLCDFLLAGRGSEALTADMYSYTSLSKSHWVAIRIGLSVTNVIALASFEDHFIIRSYAILSAGAMAGCDIFSEMYHASVEYCYAELVCTSSSVDRYITTKHLKYQQSNV